MLFKEKNNFLNKIRMKVHFPTVEMERSRTLLSLQVTNICHFDFFPRMKTMNGQYSNVALHDLVDSVWNKSHRIEGFVETEFWRENTHTV